MSRLIGNSVSSGNVIMSLVGEMKVKFEVSGMSSGLLCSVMFVWLGKSCVVM